MKQLRKLCRKFGRIFAATALFAGVASAAPICVMIFHQPKVPEGMGKFMKARK